jgi:hypothetical protein
LVISPRLPDHGLRPSFRADRRASPPTQEDAGLASGLINTSQQIGGALGIAILSTVATSVADNRLAEGIASPQAFVDGYRAAFWIGAGVGLVGVLVSVFAVRRSDLVAVQGAATAQAAA